MIFFGKKNAKVKEEEKLRKEKEEQERLRKEQIMLQRKKAKEWLCQKDAEARKVLQGECLEKYVLAKELGLNFQAEIARIEGLTNTTFIDLEEQRWILEKAIVSKLGYAIGDKSCYPELDEAVCSSVKDFSGKIPFGAMIRYQELKNEFEDIKILHFDLGSDLIMYGIITWEMEKLHFLIKMWE